MKNVIILVCWLIFGLYGHAQKSHIIIDSVTMLPIDGANAVILKFRKGVGSNNSGTLVLNTSGLNDPDTIAITHINYHSKLVCLEKFAKMDTVFLTPKVYNLEEFIISKEIDLHDYNQKHVFGFFNFKRQVGWSEFGFHSGFQIGVKMENPNHVKGLLSHIRLHFERIAPGVKFRVRLMKINEDGSIGNDILKDGIIITPRNTRPKVDLKEYRIFLPANGLFVCIDHLGDGTTYSSRLDEPITSIKLTSHSKQLTFHGYRETPWIIFPFKSKGLHSNAQIEITVLSKK